MNMKSLAMAVGLAMGSIGMVGVAQAMPILTIVQGGAVAHQEVIGDAGGSVYPWAGGPGPGAGAPSDIAGMASGPGWPDAPGFAPDPSFGGARGTSGWDESYLLLSGVGAGHTTAVTFQFMGGGDSTLQNQFWVQDPTDGIWKQMFLDSHGGNTNPCPVANGATTPSCDLIGGSDLSNAPNKNQYTLFLSDGFIPFRFITGNGLVSDNTGAGNGNPTDESGLPGYMLGADPYLAPGPFSCLEANGESCTAVYAALSDLPRNGAGPDHDYSDLAVRISISAIPEPGNLFLLVAGLMGLSGLRRRKALILERSPRRAQ